MSANARIDHDSEFGRHENDVAFGRVSQAEADNPAALALLVGRYGLFTIEGVPTQDKEQLLTLLKQKAELGKDAAIEAEDVAKYRDFASVVKMAEFHLSDYKDDPGEELWTTFQELLRIGSEQEHKQVFGKQADTETS